MVRIELSGLNQLLLPLRGDLNQLNGLQRNALNVALGFTGGPTPDRLVVSNAALELLWQAAADRPLLMIIDNLQMGGPGKRPGAGIRRAAPVWHRGRIPGRTAVGGLAPFRARQARPRRTAAGR